MYEDYLQHALSNIISARQALSEYHRNSINKNMKNIAAYNVQQALEHVLKYLIYNDAAYFKGSSDIKEIFTHDLVLLINKYYKPYKIYVPKTIMKNAHIYTRWEAETRYSLKFSVRKNSISTALKETEDWLIHIKPQYRKHIAHYRNKYIY
ncbi:MAG: HEPN domain-containing protein [Clostridium sp.]|nr:HEPN domain-containing protein [Clostridium sp.]